MVRRFSLLAAALVAAAPLSQGWAQASTAAVTVEVKARAETVPVGTMADDAADDPAIWLNRRDPSASLIVATDKKAGLYVYGLDGKVRHFVADGRLNNVDLIDMGRAGVMVVASDRNDKAAARLRLYRLDTVAAQLVPLAVLDGGAGEAYGLCLVRRGSSFDAFSVLKDGLVAQVRVSLGKTPAGTIVRYVKVPTQTEGCVVDSRSETLYVGEEDVGIWAFDARARGPVVGRLAVKVDGTRLVADVEGLALARQGRKGGWLVASSQGDNAYSLYRLPDLEYAGRFRIAKGAFGSVEETDGIELKLGNFGPDYPLGLFVAQDGMNEPAAQNFKLVSWADVLAALGK
ncbi:MAG TPA: phytase [Novosphingobium sp.]|nr:phytase [Novosphingobium sp.]HQA17231.1 phytase [Novosphingobium sp.]